MHDFFKSFRFKAILVLIAFLIGVMIFAVTKGGYSLSGASSCIDCPSGQTSSAGAASCSSCESNCSSCSNTTTNCTSCKKGYYKDGNTCKQCAAGKYQPNDNSTATSCTSCPSGKYASGTGNSACTSCPSSCSSTR